MAIFNRKLWLMQASMMGRSEKKKKEVCGADATVFLSDAVS